MFITFSDVPSLSVSSVRPSVGVSFRRGAPAVVLPCLPDRTPAAERGIYMAFIRSLREGMRRRMDVRILNAIYQAADLTGHSDAYVSRVLADMGLRASRLAFPGDFLDHVDATFLRERPLGRVPASYVALRQHWGEGDPSVLSSIFS